MQPSIPVTFHGTTRMCQRSVKLEHLAYAYANGKRLNRAGAEWIVMRKKDVPSADIHDPVAQRSVGLVICILGGEVATVYRTQHPEGVVRRKPRYAFRSRHHRDALAADDLPLADEGFRAA